MDNQCQRGYTVRERGENPLRFRKEPMKNEDGFIVIALGGSIIVPELSNEGGIDVQYLRRFRRFILTETKKGRRFIIVAGGGKTSRVYQRSVSRIVRVPAEDLDWIGIHSSRLNAHLLRTIFRDMAHPVVIDHDLSLREARNLSTAKYPVLIASGWSPGWSTDFIAARLTHIFGAQKAIIAGDTPFVYEEDPKKNGNAGEITEMSWKSYRQMIPKKWSPGLSLPIDPVAAKLGEKESLVMNVIDGRDLKNMGRAIGGKRFIGTTVS